MTQKINGDSSLSDEFKNRINNTYDLDFLEWEMACYCLFINKLFPSAEETKLTRCKIEHISKRVGYLLKDNWF